MVYNWDNSGHYTFKFYVDTTLTTNNYNGFVQCTVPLTPLGIESQNNVNSEFSLYPNPVTKTLYLNGASGLIRIYSIEGKQVFQSAIATQNIDVSRFEKGLYMLSLENEQGRVTKKFVVQ